jgi:hypothetical protein
MPVYKLASGLFILCGHCQGTEPKKCDICCQTGSFVISGGGGTYHPICLELLRSQPVSSVSPSQCFVCRRKEGAVFPCCHQECRKLPNKQAHLHCLLSKKYRPLFNFESREVTFICNQKVLCPDFFSQESDGRDLISCI